LENESRQSTQTRVKEVSNAVSRCLTEEIDRKVLLLGNLGMELTLCRQGANVTLKADTFLSSYPHFARTEKNSELTDT
jgi:hypothetical protein